MNLIEKLHEEEKVEIFTTDTMEEELTPDSSQWHKQADYIYALKKPDQHEYPKRFEKIKQIVFPKVVKLTLNQERDIHHLATHLKYLHDFFLTTDGAILEAAPCLELLGIRAITPEGYLKSYWPDLVAF